MIKLAVPAEALLMLTGLVAPKLNVGGFTLPAGLEVMAAVSVTVPVSPPDGVTVMVDMFPVVAPGPTVTAEPVIAKPGGVTAVSPVVAEVVAAKRLLPE
jgi:hypothetical protein